LSRTYTIQDLTKAFGITSRTLRHYEDEGLISPERRGQTRLYSARDRARLSLILRGKRVGFGLAEIAEILDLYEKPDGGAAQLTLARKKFAERVALLERQQADIEESLAELRLGLTMIDNKLAERHEDTRTQPRIRLTGYGVMPAED
jgi:DNA-binding transcriptional MerR regulator